MSNWYLLGNFAYSDDGQNITKQSENTYVNSNGTIYTKLGNFVSGSDGTFFANVGNVSSDGSTRVGNMTNGLGALFLDNEI